MATRGIQDIPGSEINDNLLLTEVAVLNIPNLFVCLFIFV